MSFYRGYVITREKKCIEKFNKKAKLHSLHEVKNLSEYAGIIANDSILIDVDDMESSNKLLNIVEAKNLNCRVLQSRSGMHFLFKNHTIEKCYTKVNLACGIVADIKCGVKNCYEVLKIDGKDREVIYDIEDTEEYEDIPKMLYPVKSNIDFNNLGEGDGRNQTLFNYILTLQSNGFEKEEARETISFINKYVLDESLPDDEMEKILRDDAFKTTTFFNRNKFLHDKFALFLISEHHIIRINGQLHIYKDGIYVNGTNEIEHMMLKHLPQLTKAKRNEVLSYIDVYILDNTEVSSANFIAFKNGIYNIMTDTLEPFNPALVITNKIPWDYVPGAYCESVDKVLNNVSVCDDNIKALLCEMIGYCLYRRNELGKCFVLTGSGKNGKSTFLNMVKRLLGDDNISVLDMKKLGDRFSTVMLYNKLANIGDDISDEYISDDSIFKKIVTGETIDAEQKGQPKFQFSPYCKLAFSANSIPRIGRGRDSSAILRRMVIIPFNATFDKHSSDYDGYIIDQLSTPQAMEYLIKLGIEGLKRVLETQEFTTSESVEMEMEEYAVSNNPILHFVDENDRDNIVNFRTTEIYLRYQKFCNDNGYQAVNSRIFNKEIKKNYNLRIVRKRINGAERKVYVE